MSIAIPFRSLFTSTLAGTLLCLRPQSSAFANETDNIAFETHRTHFENEVVELDYRVLYPIEGPNERLVKAMQRQFVKDCFPDFHIERSEPIEDSQKIRDQLGANPISLISDRVRYYSKNRAGILRNRQESNAKQYAYHAAIPAVSISPKLISWTSDHSTYTGGAHGNHYQVARLLDAKTGRVMAPSELWEATSESAIRRAVVRALLREHELPPSSAFGDLPVYCAESEIPLTNVFADKNGLKFIYSPYVIGPYSAGYFIADVPWRELVPHFKPKWRSLATVGWRTITTKAIH